MELDKLSETVSAFLEEESKGLSPNLLEWIKNQFDSNIATFLGENLGQLKVGLVLDTNIAIKAITQYAKGKNSILFHLEKNPIFPIYAPLEIEDEVLNYVNNDAKNKKRYDKKKLLEGWNRLKKILIMKNVVDKKIRDKALEMMGKRDPLDAPFVSVYIETGASAILTDDNDYENLAIRRFNIEKLDDIVATFHKGVYSFFIFNDAIPLILQLLAKLILAIIKMMFQLVMFVVKLGKDILTGSVEKIMDLFSKIPKGIEKGLGIALIASAVMLTIVLVVKEDLRKKLANSARSAIKKIKVFVEKIIKWILDAVDFFVSFAKSTKPAAEYSLTVLAEIYKNIVAISDAIKNMSSESAYFA